MSRQPEGWEEDADGSRHPVRLHESELGEEIDVPVGPDNNLQPGGPDLGQPTHFQPRRNRFMFRVRVPKAFTETDEMIWTLTTKESREGMPRCVRTTRSTTS